MLRYVLFDMSSRYTDNVSRCFPPYYYPCVWARNMDDTNNNSKTSVNKKMARKHNNSRGCLCNLVTQRGLWQWDCCLRRWLDESCANRQRSREGNGAGKGAIPFTGASTIGEGVSVRFWWVFVLISFPEFLRSTTLCQELITLLTLFNYLTLYLWVAAFSCRFSLSLLLKWITNNVEILSVLSRDRYHNCCCTPRLCGE